MYKHVLKPILFLFPPESVHNFFIFVGKVFGYCKITQFLTWLMYGYRGSDISKTVDGVKYKTPILLSAGFDYNGNLTQILPYTSFGGEEIGSISAKPYAGNKKPRLTRMPFSKSIIVNKGLKNEGVDVVLNRLKNKRTKTGFVLGISIARTNLPESASVTNGIADYVESFKKVVESGLGDYYTINISCPNTCGGEPFTTADLLSKLFIELDKIARSKPLYVKMPINVLDNVFVQLLGVLDHHNVQGVIVGNLNKDYSTLDKRDPVPTEYRGGLSGQPCFNRSNELIALTKKEYGNRFTIIGCGGVFSYEDAKIKFDLGADLIHMITGMIYEGPALIQKICQGLGKK